MLSQSSVIASDLAGMSWIVGGVAVMAFALLAIRYLQGQYLTDRLRRSVAATLIPDNVALCTKPVLTEAEARFFRSLEKAVDGKYLVCPQLPLWTFIDVFSSDAGVVKVFTNRIDRQRVDFTLVDRQTHKVYKAIELDERSHTRADRLRRDAFVEMVLKQAGVPLIRIASAKTYDAQAIRTQLGLNETEVNRSKSA